MAALKGKRRCFAHSPTTMHQRRAASSRGGRNNRTPKAQTSAPVSSTADLQRHVGQVLADVLLRENTERRALSVARLIEVARKLIEQEEVERRLEMVEQRLTAMERRP
jgi:hypothetical protein